MDHPQQFEEDQEGYERWCAERDAADPSVQKGPPAFWMCDDHFVRVPLDQPCPKCLDIAGDLLTDCLGDQ